VVSQIAANIKKRQHEKRENSVKQNESKYGMNVMTEKSGAGERIGSAAATIGGDALKGTGYGLAAGAAIGSVIPVIGTTVGAAVGAAIGFVGGLVSGIYKAVVNDKETQEWNRIADIGRHAVEVYEENQKIDAEINKKLGRSNVDAKLQIVALNKVSKTLKRISDGAYTAKYDNFAQGALNSNKLISMVGGTDSSFTANKR
jgi:hypothetical protein